MPTDAPTRCIWLAPPQTACGDRSRPHLLSKQGWDVTAFDDPVLAMAELAVCERAQAARSAWGLERAARVVLAVEDPDGCSQVSAMLAAVARYMPDIAVWDCSNGHLRPKTLTPTSSASAEVVGNEPGAVPQAEESGAWQSDTPEAPITREELDMLLDLGGEDQ